MHKDASPADVPPLEVVEKSTIVEKGDLGYETFRIPVQVRAPNGDLLLFCEARKSGGDFGDNDIFLFRSTDGGTTWDEEGIVIDNGTDTASDIAALVEGDRIHLLYQERPSDRDFGSYLYRGASDAYGYHIHSDDNGETWSNPNEITDQVLPDSDEQLPMFGPNNGIVLDSGRLLVPMYYANQTTEKFTPAVIYSDDGGQTWQRSEDAIPEGGVNETAVVQVPNGDIYAVARNGTNPKQYFRSTDGGETWAETGDVGDPIPGVSVQQSMVSRGERLFLATPEKSSRNDGRLKTGTYDISQPDNVDWDDQDLQITPDGFAYSSMALQDSTIHLVHEVESGDDQYSGQYESLEYVQIRVLVPSLSIQDGSSDGLDFSPEVSPGTTNNAVGIFSLSAEQAGAAFDSVAVTNTAPGVEGISAARLFWSEDQSLDVSADTELSEVTTDPSEAPGVISFSGFSPSISATAHYAILAIDVEEGASADVQFELTQEEDLSVPGGEVDTVNGQHQSTFSALPLSEGMVSLPVEIAHFSAQLKSQEAVSLRWQTASETNNSAFRVQRRIPDSDSDGKSWTKIGSVKGAGTTNKPQSYRFTDRKLPHEADSLLYRLEQVGVNKSESYSQVISIERGPVKQARLLKTYPNPTRNQVTVRFAVPAREDNQATLRLYDVMGRQVSTIQAETQAGRHKMRLDTSRLSSGAYFLRLRVGATTESQRLTVVR
jgi:photosystem II stability/assembly factor-like uncharacterized protein